MWRYVAWFIILGILAMILLGWTLWYWRSRRDVLDDQAFEREVMEHEKEMRSDGDK